MRMEVPVMRPPRCECAVLAFFTRAGDCGSSPQHQKKSKLLSRLLLPAKRSKPYINVRANLFPLIYVCFVR